jgi:diaminopimelate decarboxylase
MMPTGVAPQEREETRACAVTTPSPGEPTIQPLVPPPEALREIVWQYGTPTYAYDLSRIRAQVTKLRTHFPAAVEILYSLKANASLGVCGVMADLGLGADVASAGELMIARAAGFPPACLVLTGPDKSPPVLAELASYPEMILSLDSVSELALVAQAGLPQRLLLRLRPDFCSYATCSAGPDSRFGLTLADVPACRPFLAAGMKVVGFHVFSGSQVLATEGIVHHLRGGLDLALRAADRLGLTPEIVDIGGGFGIPYGPGEQELDIAAIGQELQALVARAAPARLVIELGRYLIAESGWYLTRVIAEQSHRGRKAVVVDGGSHQRSDLCGVGLRHKVKPVVLAATEHATAGESLVPTDVLGCLSLPADVLAEAAPLPPLALGDILAIPKAGAYGLYGSPCLFHAHPPPAEVAFDGDRLELLRTRLPLRSVLDGQLRVGAR